MAKRKMRYVSLFSGIEAASVAWEPLGWEPVAFSEIDKLPCVLLAKRYPHVPNLGDITKIDWSLVGSVDIVVGGSPCQSFSVAGKRDGLAGQSGLMFEYIRAVRFLRPRYFVWENVPGALSSEAGAAFGQLLSEMDDIGYGLAWRVLDAQFFGVAQRRRRVFLVGVFGETKRAGEILFERESVSWDTPSSREKRQELTGAAKLDTQCICYGTQGNTIDRAAYQNGSGISEQICPTLNTVDRHVVAFDTTQITSPTNGSNPQFGDPCHPLCASAHVPVVEFSAGNSAKAGSIGLAFDLAPTLRGGSSGTNQVPTVCMADDTSNASIDFDLSGTLKCGGMPPSVTNGHTIRRLMPVECERLQGFPDGWTDLGDTPDSQRYKALGNSMAVPVMRWIGERIADVDAARDGSDDGR